MPGFHAGTWAIRIPRLGESELLGLDLGICMLLSTVPQGILMHFRASRPISTRKKEVK